MPGRFDVSVPRIRLDVAQRRAPQCTIAEHTSDYKGYAEPAELSITLKDMCDPKGRGNGSWPSLKADMKCVRRETDNQQKPLTTRARRC